MAALLAAATPAHADVLSEMNRFWQGAAVNTTGPTAFQGQAVWPLDPRQPLSPLAGALGADRNGEPAVVPVRLRRHRRLRRGVLVHQLRPADRLRARRRAERRRLRLRAGPGDNLAGDRRDDGQAPGAGAVGELTEPQLLRDRPGAGGRAVVQERPGIRRDLRRCRHGPGHLLGLRRREARLRRGWAAQLDAGVRFRGDGGPGAGQRQLRLEGDPGVVLPVGRHAARRVRHGGHGHADRDVTDLRRRHLRPSRPHPGAAGARPPRDRGADGGRRPASGLPLRHPRRLPQPEPGDGDDPPRPGLPGAGGVAAARSRRCRENSTPRRPRRRSGW